MTDIRTEIEATAAQFIAELGGEAVITEAQRYQIRRAAELGALANALRARAVNGEPIDIGELGRIEAIASDAITALGIAPAQPRAGHIDLSKLTDDDLAALEALHVKARVAGPPPEAGDRAAVVNELLDLNAKLNGLVARANERAVVAEQCLAPERSVFSGNLQRRWPRARETMSPLGHARNNLEKGRSGK
jgi:hypothetical protein